MATKEESTVFEYYSGVFKELEKLDGGYFPHKHDPVTLRRTAEHFSISENEASRISEE